MTSCHFYSDFLPALIGCTDILLSANLQGMNHLTHCRGETWQLFNNTAATLWNILRQEIKNT